MALKVKNPKKNLADILIEKERLNESYDSSSAVSLQTLETVVESEETAEKPENKPVEVVDEGNRPNESRVEKSISSSENKGIETTEHTAPSVETMMPTTAYITEPVVTQVQASVPQSQAVRQTVQQPIQRLTEQPLQQQVQAPAQQSITPVYERPIYEIDDYNPPRKKRGRPYQGYAENTHVQSIYVRNDLYEYIMINYVGHGRKHSSYNKFVNAAINNYLRMLDEQK